jgi:hypothetical protein
LENEITGYGEYYWRDGKCYKGQWKNSKMNGNSLKDLRPWSYLMARRKTILWGILR